MVSFQGNLETLRNILKFQWRRKLNLDYLKEKYHASVHVNVSAQSALNIHRVGEVYREQNLKYPYKRTKLNVRKILNTQMADYI
jgi:hypothetical protein